jgi:hypothetical protein
MAACHHGILASRDEELNESSVHQRRQRGGSTMAGMPFQQDQKGIGALYALVNVVVDWSRLPGVVGNGTVPFINVSGGK